MNKFIFLFVFAFLLNACNDEKSNDKTTSKSSKADQPKDVKVDLNEPEIEEIPSLRKCYTLKNGTTDAQLYLELEDDLVTGDLFYHGENPLSGTVIGEFSGDTLILAFKYRENDTKKVEEIVLLQDKENFTLQMGSTELIEKNGIKSIKDRKKIKFDGPIFQKLDCKQEEVF